MFAWRARTISSRVAAAVLIAAGFVIALLLPMYTGTDPYVFEDIRRPGAGPTCIVSDTGTSSQLAPTKITTAAAGIVSATFMVLWTRGRTRSRNERRGPFIVFAALWFILT